MSQKDEARKRVAALKRLRDEHKHTVSNTQALLKEQKKVQRDVCQTIRDTAKTVPEIAAELNMPKHEVLWYLTAFKKYGLVVEAGMCEDYVLYQRLEEEK
jgi:predicted transcriptional regulator